MRAAIHGGPLRARGFTYATFVVLSRLKDNVSWSLSWGPPIRMQIPRTHPLSHGVRIMGVELGIFTSDQHLE